MFTVSCPHYLWSLEMFAGQGEIRYDAASVKGGMIRPTKSMAKRFCGVLGFCQ